MMTTINPDYYDQKARQVRLHASRVLTRWGLLPRFKRWRLTQDSSTGMIVLFGILNNRYIATHTSTPFSNYFDPRLLRDLANELQVQVVSCNSDGLRYAFILDRGQLGRLPTHIDYPFDDEGKLLVRVVYDDSQQPIPVLTADNTTVDDHTLVQEGVGAFLKVFDDIKLREDTATQIPAQNSPDIVMIDKDEFNKRVTEHEALRQRSKRINKLIGSITEETRQ
jgi:hypothetical protein